MSQDNDELKQTVDIYLSNNQHNVPNLFELIFVPSNTADYILNDLGESLDILLDYRKVAALNTTIVKNMTLINCLSFHGFDTEDSNSPYGAYVLLPLLFEAYNIHAHWLNETREEDCEALVNLIPIKTDDSTLDDTMNRTEYQHAACGVLKKLVAGAMSTSSNTAPIYDNVTLSKCGKYVFVPVPMSDYSDTEIDAVKIYAKKLMKSILIKANSHHPETQVSNSSLFASYLTSLSLQN